MKNSNETIGNQTRDLAASSAVLQKYLLTLIIQKTILTTPILHPVILKLCFHICNSHSHTQIMYEQNKLISQIRKLNKR